ncbi:MAG: hypothetical protein ACRC62_17505 [Microcoleus sp.]
MVLLKIFDFTVYQRSTIDSLESRRVDGIQFLSIAIETPYR